jgi:Zn-dependent M28 family amino/carboxypeptidase
MIKSNVDLVKDQAMAYNVVAMIEGGDPLLKDQFVIIGAHYDHLGMGGFGSGSRVPDTTAVHYGADDNASGVAAMIELAKYFAQPENKPARSLVFVAFDAEEMGLIGSRYFADNPPIDLAKVTAMINFDMIGRLKESNTISIGGTGTSLETTQILDRLAEKYPLQLAYSTEGFGPSDHAAFYSKNLPVFFISTGAHADYHTPRDNPESINAEGIVKVLDFSAGLVAELANRSEMLTFQEAGPSARGDHRYNFKVTLGIMPDMTSSGNDGLKVEAVRPGAPAASGGMLKGDVITAIDGNPVGNIYDYMGRLKNLEAGQVISVDIIREGKQEVLIIQL